MRVLIAACAAVLVASCATARPEPEPVVQTVEVLVPVPTPCRVDIGSEPVFADSDEALSTAPDVFEAMKLRIVGRFQRIAWSAVQAAALAGCAGTNAEERVQQ